MFSAAPLLFPPRIWLKAPANKEQSHDDGTNTQVQGLMLFQSGSFIFSLCVLVVKSLLFFFALGPPPPFSPHWSLWGVICGGIKPLPAGACGESTLRPCRNSKHSLVHSCTQACAQNHLHTSPCTFKCRHPA